MRLAHPTRQNRAQAVERQLRPPRRAPYVRARPPAYNLEMRNLVALICRTIAAIISRKAADLIRNTSDVKDDPIQSPMGMVQFDNYIFPSCSRAAPSQRQCTQKKADPAKRSHAGKDFFALRRRRLYQPRLRGEDRCPASGHPLRSRSREVDQRARSGKGQRQATEEEKEASRRRCPRQTRNYRLTHPRLYRPPPSSSPRNPPWHPSPFSRPLPIGSFPCLPIVRMPFVLDVVRRGENLHARARQPVSRNLASGAKSEY